MYDVAICGLGPVGQLLALLLGDHGVRVLAFDRDEEPYDLPRAAVIDDEVLRIFQALAMDRAVLADAQVQPGASIVTAAGRAVEVFRARSGRLGHPPLVSINQPAMEKTMLRALGERPTVELRRGLTLESLDRRADRVDLYLRPTAGGRSEQVSARWLVGCDGGSSAVRARLQVPFCGRTAPQRWIVVDALVDRPLAKVPHPHFIGDPGRPAVTLPMSPGRHRWEWMLHSGEDPAPLMEPAALRARVDEWLDGQGAEIERAVVYTFHTRMAARWRRGRVLLAGDAAHLMPPFAGQGFSSGARDAFNLAWKLAAVLEGAPGALLDTYERERRPHVAAMQRLANLMGGFVQSTTPRRVRVRDAWLSGIDGTRLQHLVAGNLKPLPTYGGGAFAQRPHRLAPKRVVGSLFPQSDRLDDRLPRGWVALVTDDVARSLFEDHGLTVVDPGTDGAWLRERGLAFAVLRPDRFVFAAGAVGDVPGALEALRAITGATGAAVGPRLTGRPARPVQTLSRRTRHHHQGLNMVTRIGHIALNVADLDEAVDFQQQVMGMVEVERANGASYMTCNERHHELILVENPGNRGYDHLALQVADAVSLERAAKTLPAAGATLLGGIYDGEPGIDRALKVQSPAGHVYKLFCGMETVNVELSADRPTHFEHISCKVPRHRAEETFLTALGFTHSDRMGFLASWWHCDEDHHGIALTRAPRSELSHYAYAWSDLNALGRVADRLKASRGRKCIWGPSRHGPGNNMFLYLHDQDGAMIECCAGLAQMTRDAYQPRTWSMAPATINQWGGPPPLRFLLTGYPIATPTPGRPTWAAAPGRRLAPAKRG